MSGHEARRATTARSPSTVRRRPAPAPRTAALAARFDPLAGHVVWSGRVAAELAPRTRLVVATPHGSARAEAIETDVWGNTRLTGVGRPPFPVELLDGAERPDVSARSGPAFRAYMLRSAECSNAANSSPSAG